MPINNHIVLLQKNNFIQLFFLTDYQTWHFFVFICLFFYSQEAYKMQHIIKNEENYIII